MPCTLFRFRLLCTGFTFFEAGQPYFVAGTFCIAQTPWFIAFFFDGSGFCYAWCVLFSPCALFLQYKNVMAGNVFGGSGLFFAWCIYFSSFAFVFLTKNVKEGLFLDGHVILEAWRGDFLPRRFCRTTLAMCLSRNEWGHEVFFWGLRHFDSRMRYGV